jgi:hypothetical protein
MELDEIHQLLLCADDHNYLVKNATLRREWEILSVLNTLSMGLLFVASVYFYKYLIYDKTKILM